MKHFLRDVLAGFLASLLAALPSEKQSAKPGRVELCYTTPILPRRPPIARVGKRQKDFSRLSPPYCTSR